MGKPCRPLQQLGEQMQEELTPQRWGSKERMALVAEVLRQRRMVDWLCGCLENRSEKGAETWKMLAEHAVKEEISPEA